MSLFTAFKSNDSSNELLVTSTADGATWPSSPSCIYTNNQTSASPAMTLFQGKLYIAFKSNDSSNKLLVTSSVDGVTWPSACVYANNQTSTGPAIAVFQEKLYIVFKSNDSSNKLLITSSADGASWPSSPSCIYTNNTTLAGPGMVCNSVSISNVVTPKGYATSIFGGETGSGNVGQYVIGNPIPVISSGCVYFLGVPGLGSASLQFKIDNGYNYLVTFDGGGTASLACMPGESISISVDINGQVVLSVGRATASSTLVMAMGQSGPILQLMVDMISYSPSLQASWNNSAISTIYSMGYAPCLLNNLAFQCYVSPDCCEQFSTALQTITFPAVTYATEFATEVESSSISCTGCFVLVNSIAVCALGALVLSLGFVPATAGTEDFIAVLEAWSPFQTMCDAAGFNPSRFATMCANTFIKVGATGFVEATINNWCQSIGACSGSAPSSGVTQEVL